MPGTLSVPLRRPPSWPPPSIMRLQADARRAAADVQRRRRPWDRRSCGRRSSSDRPGAARRRRASCRRPGWRRCAAARPARWQSCPISASGWIAPISLLASMTETRIVSSRMASATCSSRMQPGPRVGRLARPAASVTSKPWRRSRSSGSSTEGCSVATLTMWLPLRTSFSATPRMARLLLSVAPLVKTISLAAAPIAAAIVSRAASTASLACPAEGVGRAAGVAEGLGEVRQHRLQHPRIDRRGGVVVEVDGTTRIMARRRKSPSCKSATRSRSRSCRPGSLRPVGIRTR